jgi:hypothetical protein
MSAVLGWTLLILQVLFGIAAAGIFVEFIRTRRIGLDMCLDH